MISNLDRISSDSISRTVNYVLKDSAQVVATNMPAGLLKKCRNLTTSFRSIASLNKRVKKPLYHISIRCAPEDGSLSPLEWSKISGRFLELMELEENPFTAATHGDNHVHLLISRVDDSGKCYDASWDCFKAQKALRTIESEGK
ncbi:MAG: relaxase/mobilization nuclease domain-containing protein [Spirulinaceae cyanobacterium]